MHTVKSMMLNPFEIFFMPKYIIPNQIPRKYEMETILSKTKPEYGSSRSFLSHMEELYISGWGAFREFLIFRDCCFRLEIIIRLNSVIFG